MRPFRIRRYRPSHIENLMEVERASFGRDAYDRKLFAEYSHKCGELFLIAEGIFGLHRRICGYSLTCTRGDRAELVSIAVYPALRGRGIASALLASTLRRLRRRKIARLSLMVRLTNTAARAFYEKFGFSAVRTVHGYYEDGGDGCLMGKQL